MVGYVWNMTKKKSCMAFMGHLSIPSSYSEYYIQSVKDDF